MSAHLHGPRDVDVRPRKRRRTVLRLKPVYERLQEQRRGAAAPGLAASLYTATVNFSCTED